MDLPAVGSFVDGCAVRRVGSLPFALLRDRIDELIQVDNDQVCGAIRALYEDTRTLVEPAGALARRRDCSPGPRAGPSAGSPWRRW
ncbi:MAG: hypothetical protein RML12_01930 [Xanthomonadales bacterium]|nr:hypothetical protein [Xanthomonadales bacterium]